jgi:ribonuclease BN (tRNA processing enzyme)
MSDVVFIGTSDAFGAGGRRQSAILVRALNGNVLMDCGTTTGTGMTELGITRDEIDAIVLSHFHGDHFGGVPTFLLGALYEDGRKHPLRIAGPPGTEAKVRELAAAMCYELEGREWSFPILFEELVAGQKTEVGPVTLHSFQTFHQPHTCPHGLMVDTGKSKIAYSGDTGWFEELPARVAGADLFICECTYHTFEFEYHLNHTQLVERRKLFDCGRIVLTHFGPEMVAFRDQSEFEAADDGTVIKL